MDRVNGKPVNHRFALRNRFSMGFSHQLFKPVSTEKKWSIRAVTTVEFFLNIKLKETDSWFDQYRIIVGPELKLNDRLSMQLLYNFQFAPVTGSPDFKLTHVAWFTIRHRLDFSK